MKEAACALGLNDVPVPAYGLRHGGASDDLLARRRAAFDVRLRGGWASDDDFKWYAMQARFPTELLRVGSQGAPLPELCLTCRGQQSLQARPGGALDRVDSSSSPQRAPCELQASPGPPPNCGAGAVRRHGSPVRCASASRSRRTADGLRFETV
eukprot:8354837-Pyramimonas_sp.AAC.1